MTARLVELPRTPLAIPEGRAGRFFVVHETLPVGAPVSVVSMRSAYLAGVEPEVAVPDRPARVHRLMRVDLEPGARAVRAGTRGLTIMSDHPSELRWMADIMRGAAGRVLVGGFGLGLVVRFLEDRPEVESILVVEREADVLELCHVPAAGELRKTAVTLADFDAFVLAIDEWPWSVTILDLWAGTSEAVWTDEVAPRRLAIARRFGPRDVRCWAEPEMVGQIRRSLAGNAGRELDALRFSRAQWAFRASSVDDLPPDAPPGPVGRGAAILAGATDPGFAALADLFLREVGSEAWERRFGAAWDGWPGRRMSNAGILRP